MHELVYLDTVLACRTSCVSLMMMMMVMMMMMIEDDNDDDGGGDGDVRMLGC